MIPLRRPPCFWPACHGRRALAAVLKPGIVRAGEPRAPLFGREEASGVRWRAGLTARGLAAGFLPLMTKAAAQQQVLPVRGFKGAPQCVDLLTVAALELGELAGERGDDIAGLIRINVPALGRALLGAELLGALPDGGVRS